MEDTSYANFIRQACKSLGINPGNYIHFGRKVGAAHTDLKELDGYEQVRQP